MSPKLSRRELLALSAGALVAPAFLRQASAARNDVKFRIGVTDWNLRLEAKPASIPLAKQLGFDGVQVSLASGRPQEPVSNEVLDAMVAESKRVGLPLASCCLNILHRNYLKSDPRGPQRVAESIPMAKRLGVEVILLPFFGEGALETRAEMDRVADALRELAPDAERAGVIFGLEDTISARDNVYIMERAKSPAVLTYYDVGNSTKNGFQVVEEIRWLGKDRICEVHLKDNPHFMGEGTINFPAVVDALADIGFARWAVLETDSPTKDLMADMRKNLAFVRKLVEAREGATA